MIYYYYIFVLWLKTIVVKKNSVGAVYIPIEPVVIRTIKLKASARSKTATDAIERNFLVEVFFQKKTHNVS